MKATRNPPPTETLDTTETVLSIDDSNNCNPCPRCRTTAKLHLRNFILNGRVFECAVRCACSFIGPRRVTTAQAIIGFNRLARDIERN